MLEISAAVIGSGFKSQPVWHSARDNSHHFALKVGRLALGIPRMMPLLLVLSPSWMDVNHVVDGATRRAKTCDGAIAPAISFLWPDHWAIICRCA